MLLQWLASRKKDSTKTITKLTMWLECKQENSANKNRKSSNAVSIKRDSGHKKYRIHCNMRHR